MAYDYQKAIQSGASEDQVLQYLNQTRGYNVDGALKAGANKSQLIDYLSKTEVPSHPVAEQTKPGFFAGIGNTIKSAFNSGVGQVKQGFGDVANAKNPGQLFHGVGEIGTGAVGAALSPTAPIVNPTIGAAVNATGNAIGNIPAVQKFANTRAGQITSDVAENVGNYANIAGAVGGFMEAPAAGAAVKQGATKVGEVAGAIGKNIGQKSFESDLNKTLPVLKKDVANLPKKNQNVFTAFSDIAKNKDKIGLTDNAGNPRNPHTFAETVDAQNSRLPQIYKSYTDKLSTVDKTKFDTNIKTSIQDQVKSIDTQLAKENSIDGRRALTKIKTELGTLRDTSPQGIQNYVQDLNERIRPMAPGGALTTEQIKLANLAGSMRKVLDDSIEKIGGQGYQAERNIYAAHKSVQSQLLMAAKKEINKTPGFTEKLGNVGLTLEGLNFLLTHNPQTLLLGGAIKGAASFGKWITSPQRALRNVFNKIDKGYNLPKR